MKDASQERRVAEGNALGCPRPATKVGHTRGEGSLSTGREPGPPRARSPTRTSGPGGILVAEFTDPGWTPLFSNAAGPVLEVGGSLSHGAVVAREYGLPAVVGVREATKKIRTGQRIWVDGQRGMMVLL